jgi:DNA-binding transcriptional LysR family regulator
MISPSDMLLFAVVVREASFTAAGRALGITKQSVSERIAGLERALGVRLLERTTRRLRVTDAGASYYERCADIAARIDEANRDVQRAQVEPMGLLRVSAPYLYGRRYLAPVIADFLRRYPALRIELVLADRTVDLVEERFDLAIRVGRLKDSSLTARKLAEGYLYLVASPRYLRRYGVPSSAEELRRARCICMRPNEKWPWNAEQVAITPALLVNDLEAAAQAAIEDVGIALVPSIVCADAVRRRKLRTLLGPSPLRTVPVHAVLPSRDYLPPKVRLFVEALAKQVAPMRALPTR